MDRKIYFLICLFLLLNILLFADIKFTEDARVGIQQNATLNIEGSLISYANYDITNGSLYFYGSGSANAYSRINLDLNTLTIDKPSGDIMLYSYFYINDKLILKNGVVNAYNARNRTANIQAKKLKLSSLNTKKTRNYRSSDFLGIKNNASIHRYAGSLSFNPNFEGNVNLFYWNSTTTGDEIPQNTDKIREIYINIPNGTVTLTKDIKVNNLLKIENGVINTSEYEITMGINAPVEADPADIIGDIKGEALTFGTNSYTNSSLGFSITSGNDLGTFRALLFKSPAYIGNNYGILRQWKFASDNTPQNRDITFNWASSADNYETLPSLQIYNRIEGQTDWYAVSTPAAPSADPREMTLSNVSNLDYFTISKAVIGSNVNSITFNDTWVGNSSTAQFTITNYDNTTYNGSISFPSYISVSSSTRKSNKTPVQITNLRGSNRFESRNKKEMRNTSFSIGENSSITFTATFTPVSQGTYSDDIIVNFDAMNNPSKKISFTGTAKNPPEITFSPTSIADTLNFNESSTKILSIANTGGDSLSYTASISYNDRHRNNVSTVYPFNTAYSTGTCTPTDKTQNSIVEAHNTYAGWMKFDISSIPSGATIDSVVFYGYVNDANWPYWSITPVSNDPITTDASTLNTDIRDESSSGYYLRQNETSSFAAGWKTHKLEGTVVSDFQNAISQGWFAIGIASRDDNDTYYLKFDGWNETNKPYLKIYYQQSTMTWLTINSSTSYSNTLGVSASENIDIGFNSSSLNVGTYSASININSNDPNNNSVSIPVTLQVINPTISINPSSLAFGDVIVGQTSTKSFTITNSGTGTLTGTIITITGYEVAAQRKETNLLQSKNSNHNRNSLAFSLGEGESETYNLTFSPTSEQSYNGNITINNNSTSGTEYISVTGNGVEVHLTISQSTFEETLNPNQTKTDNLIISTTGQGTLTYTASLVYPSRTRSQANVYPQSQNNYTGSCNDTTFTNNSMVIGKDAEDGWFKFDLSGIPDDAQILNVDFYGYVNDTNYPWWSLTPLTNDPQTTDVVTLHNDIDAEANNGYYLRQNESSSFTTGWKSYTLEGSILTDVQNALSNDWIAMGMVSRDNNPNYYIQFDGWNETNKPYLTIEYATSDESWVLLNNKLTIQGSVTQSQPDTLQVQFSSNNASLGDHTANISLTTNDPENSDVIIPVTLHIIQTLQTPQNVSLDVTSSYVTISWDDSGATSYKVYACDTPNGTFTDVTSQGSFVTQRSRITWRISTSSQGLKKFFKITSSDQNRNLKISK